MALEEVGVKLVLEGGSFYSELNKANKALADFGADGQRSMKAAGGGFDAFETIATGALHRVGALVVDVTGKATQAVVGFAQQSIKAAGDFEGGLNEFAAAAGGSLDAAGLDVQDFSDLFIQLGKDLPVSTAEVQKAAIALVKGGLDPAVIAGGGLRDSLNFAAGAGMNLEAAAELGVKMLGTFTSVTDDAATKTAFLSSAQDLLVKAANASTLNVDSLGDAMLAAGGQAKAVGLDYEDFVTTMGLISPAFGSAAEAGTSFKNFLVRLQPSTKPATDAMMELGLYTEETGSAFYDSQGQFIGVEAASQKLKEALSGLSDAQRVQALQAIFGNDAMGAAAALADGGAQAYQAFAQQMANANGVSAQAEAVQQGLNFEMTNFQGSVEAVQIAVGQMLTPVLTDLFHNVLTPLAGKTLEFVQALQGNKEAMDGLSPTLQGLVKNTQAVGETILNLTKAVFGDKEAFQQLPTPIQAIMQGLEAFGQKVQWVTDYVGKRGFEGVLHDITPVLIGVGSVVAVAVTPAIIGATVAFGAAIVAAWPLIALFAAITAGAWLLQGGWQVVGNVILNVMSSIGQSVRSGLEGAWNALSEFVGNVWGKALEIGGNIIKGIVDGIGAFAGFLWDAITNAVRGAVDAVKRFLGIASPSVVMAMEVGAPISQGVAEGISGAAGAPQAAMASMASSLIQPIAPMGGGSSSTTITNAPQWNYSPQYNSAPPSPSQDFAAMRLLATAG